LLPSPNSRDDFIGIGGPDEGFRLRVVLLEEAVDRSLQIEVSGVIATGTN